MEEIKELLCTQNIDEFIKEKNLICGLNAVTVGNKVLYIYINENGNLDCVYENNKYKPACIVYTFDFTRCEFYIFDGKIIKNHPYKIQYYVLFTEVYFIFSDKITICNYDSDKLDNILITEPINFFRFKFLD